MQVIVSNFSVAEYCSQLRGGSIVVNRDYQRSPSVWPGPAKSYLIDTMLAGYPLPKLTLFQRTDPQSHEVIKEIVDGQQRSEAVCQFVSGRFRLSSKSPNAGRRFTQLDEADQVRFLEYQLSVDLLVGASVEQVRQLFRRINSYTVPLNRQETRHAIFQGEFKWFINDLADTYATTLKSLGVFGESQLTRMADGELFTEISHAFMRGIRTASPTALTKMYEDFENRFDEADAIRQRVRSVFDTLARWEQLHGGPLMKPLQFLPLFLAVSHAQSPVPALQEAFPLPAPLAFEEEAALANLGRLADALSRDVEADLADEVQEGDGFEEAEEAIAAERPFATFRAASAEATNTEGNRRIRFEWYCRALLPERL
jgi:hypothetical protein